MKNELERIKSDLKKLKYDFTTRVTSLENRINDIEELALLAQAKADAKPAEPKKEIIPPVIPPVVLPAAAAYTEPKKTPVEKTSIKEKPDIKMKAPGKAKPGTAVPPTPKAPKAPEVPKEAARSMFDVLAAWFAPLLIGPIGIIVDKMKTVFLDYKKQGKLPFLFLMAGGIITLVAGFGFALQYSFMALNVTARVITGFAAACGIIALGIIIIHKKKSYREYGSSLVGLGTILNFLCIYFAAASPYAFAPAWAGFALICLNTIAAYYLAMRYETKIVSVISFLGGAGVPFVLGSFAGSEIFYFSFLLLLCASTIRLGRKIKWPALVYLSFLTAAGIIEYTVFPIPEKSLFMTILFHGFSYIYVYYALFDKFSPKDDLKKEDILILGGSVSLLLINLFQVHDFSITLGFLYLANALPFLGMGFISSLSPKPLKRAAFFIIAGIIAGLAIPALLHEFHDMSLIALFWVQEAFLLLVLGFLYKLPVVRKEAYLVTLIALGQATIKLPDILMNWSNPALLKQYLNPGTLNLAVIGILFFMLSLTIKKFKTEQDPFDKKTKRFSDEAISFWGLSVFLLAIYSLLPEFTPGFAILAMPVLLLRGRKKELPFTEILGLVCYILVFIQVIISITIVGGNLPNLLKQWSTESFFTVTGHLLLIGLLLVTANILLLRIKTEQSAIVKVIKYFNNESISTWALGAFMAAVFYCATLLQVSDFTLALIIIPMPFLLIRGKNKELPITRTLGFAAYGAIHVYITYAVYLSADGMAGNSRPWDSILFNQGMAHFISIGILIIAAGFIFNWLLETIKPLDKFFIKCNDELFSVWAVAVFFVTAYYIAPGYILCLAVVPMPFLLMRAHKKRLHFTHFLGYSCYMVLLIQAALSVIEVETFSFRQQTLLGKIALVESFLLLWVMQWFYEKKMPHNPGMNIMKSARIFFYMALPVIFLPHVIKHQAGFFPIAIWLSFAICFALWEFLNLGVLLGESRILAIAAALSTTGLAIARVDFLSMPIALASLAAGIIILMGITVWKKGFTEDPGEENPYGLFFKLAFIYPGLALFSVILTAAGSIPAALHTAGFYALVLAFFRDKILPVKPHFTAWYRVGQVCVILGLTGNLVQAFTASSGGSLPLLGFPVLGMGALTWLTFGDRDLYLSMAGKNRDTARGLFLADQYIFHLVLLVLYVVAPYTITGNWMGAYTSIFLVIHAIFVMFYSTIKGQKKLIPLYAALFAAAILKIVIHDLRNFVLYQKIIAFMIIGVVMLAAAYFMQRFVSPPEE
ncbi:MAG: DUF2339 domain-containing protein [bacterium]|nr:DUF2339 domain-containing protein [bacterium]